MSLNSACSPALSRRRSGVTLRPSAWQREHSSTNFTSPASMAGLGSPSARGGFANGSSTRAGGVGTAPPPSLKAMMRLVFSYLTTALLGGIGPFGDAGAAVAHLHGDVLLAVDRIGHRRRHDVAAGLDDLEHLAGVGRVHPQPAAAAALEHEIARGRHHAAVVAAHAARGLVLPDDLSGRPDPRRGSARAPASPGARP